MVMQKSEILTPVGKDNDMLSNNMLNEVITAKKKEAIEIQNQVQSESIHLQTIRENQRKLTSDFNQKQALEEAKLDKELSIKRNSLITREEQAEGRERNLAKREAEILEREKSVFKVDEERKQLFTSRIETEKLRTELGEQLQRQTSLNQELQRQVGMIDVKSTQADNKLNDAKELHDAATRKMDAHKVESDRIQKELDNLEAIRKEVEPQLKELKEENKKRDEQLKEITAKENSILGNIAEDKNLLAMLTEREKILKINQTKVDERAEHLMRQEIIYRNQGAKNV